MPPGSIATPQLWLLTVAAVVALIVIDFLITRRPHAVGMREATAWSVVYVALPLAFGGWVWARHGAGIGLEYYTGYLVEKSLSIDNLFVFMLLLGSFAVPRELQQRALLIGVAGALALRGVFIALGAQLIASGAWAFLLFGVVLLATAVQLMRDALRHDEAVGSVDDLLVVRLLRRRVPITGDYAGTRMSVRRDGRRMLTPMGLVVVALLTTDVMFAIDSVPAVYGITGDPYLVFATNAFALLGLRALYFVLAGALGSLAHLGHGLAVILAFIGTKLVLHWAHGVWPAVPTVPTLASLGVILGILTVVVVTSLVAARRGPRPAPDEAVLTRSAG